MSTPPSWTPDGDTPRRRSVIPPNSTPPSAASPAGAARPAWPSVGAAGAGAAGAGAAPRSASTSRRPGTSAAGKKSARGAGRPAEKKRFIDYPRAGKTGVRRWLLSWRQILSGVLLAGLLGVGAFVVLYQMTPVPSPADFADAQTTTVYYADGTTPMGTFGVQNRVIVPADQIPKTVKDAVVAGEDRTFYENPGVDPVGILRALYTNIRYGEHQGGSSITQQYAERYFFNETVSSMQGKLKEALLAVKLDRQQDKDEILSNYLNTIYFGRDSYGIETAAQSYFGVGVADLDVSQAAMLAAVIPSPNNFDPRVSQENAERRWDYVLDGMVETGTLSQADRDALVLPETIEYLRSDMYAGPQGYLLTMVRDEILSTTSITDEDLDQVGYTITTTIDPALQTQMVDAVSRVPADHDPNLHIAMVTLDPQDGAILALYGGADYLVRQRNAVTQDVTQAGSTFKPLTLAAYLEQGGSLKSHYSGRNRVEVEGFTGGVRNYGNESFGNIDVIKATADSVNAVYAQMNVEIGPDKTVDAAVRAGVPADALGLTDNPGNVLGTASPHPIDMAEAYNTFAAGGLHSDPFIIRSVTYLDGDVVSEGGAIPERVFEQGVMADATFAMEAVTKPGGTARKAGTIGYPVAGKTGTSNDNMSAWFVGFTHQLTTAVAMYQSNEEGGPVSITPFDGYRYITGGSAPADLWTDYMAQAMAGREKIDFPSPVYGGEPNTPPVVEVPDVVGMNEADAVAALEGVGLVAASVTANDPEIPEGQVISSDPTAGAEAEEGSTVTLTLSAGPGAIATPDVNGLFRDEAVARLESAGLVVEVVEASSDEIAEGLVISTDPGAGNEVTAGDTVTITVSTGPETDPGEDPLPPPPPPGDESGTSP